MQNVLSNMATWLGIGSITLLGVMLSRNDFVGPDRSVQRFFPAADPCNGTTVPQSFANKTCGEVPSRCELDTACEDAQVSGECIEEHRPLGNGVYWGYCEDDASPVFPITCDESKNWTCRRTYACVWDDYEGCTVTTQKVGYACSRECNWEFD